MKMIEVKTMGAEVLKTYGFSVVIELDVAIEDIQGGRIYYCRIPKVVDIRDELKLRYPELFGVRGNPELTKKWEG